MIFSTLYTLKMLKYIFTRIVIEKYLLVSEIQRLGFIVPSYVFSNCWTKVFKCVLIIKLTLQLTLMEYINKLQGK